ncbi:MAG TPA: heavy-metal-associated domain-containing protein [Candidatus Wallbacteria bacterium]|mgnify:CR=1 FL=1|nr:heavy-metal-associated domain-containing protein [Candidatus Wallbacteria bacterium]
MSTKSFTIPKMACGNCFNIIKNALTKVNGVNGIVCDLSSRTVSVEFDETLTSDTAVSDKLSKIGFPAEINR